MPEIYDRYRHKNRRRKPIKIPLPGFRMATYAAIMLGTFCYLSPFVVGWGRPSKTIELLTVLFVLLVMIAGLRTIQGWETLRSEFRYVAIFFTTVLWGVAILYKVLSPKVCSHRFMLDHMELVLYWFYWLGGFALLMTIQSQIRRAETKETETTVSIESIE